jgi:hypothetical protein
MPLTDAEADFLEAYLYEYMRLELGPASRKLKDRGFVYSDVIFLLDVYFRLHPSRLELVPDEAGNLVEELIFGRKNENPPDPPWPTREAAQRRNAEILAERDATMMKPKPPPAHKTSS